MVLKWLNSQWKNKVVNRVALHTILIVPFVLQTLGIVSIIGYLSFRNGQRAVADLANQLQAEITARIQERVYTYLEMPHLVNAINGDAVRFDRLDLSNFSELEHYFWKQHDVFEAVSYIFFGNPQGEIIGVEKHANGRFEVGVSDQTTGGNFYEYWLDQTGQRQQLLEIKQDFDARDRPWYDAAVQAGQATWSPVYVWVGAERKLSIDAVLPVYAADTGNLQGVFSVSLSLEDISAFLRQLEIGQSGETFIVDRRGALIANSTPEQPFQISPNGRQQQRLKAIDSQNPLIRETASYLNQSFQHYFEDSSEYSASNSASKTLQHSQPFKQVLNHQAHFLQVTPLQDDRGIDWLIVVAVPEADFMDQIQVNTRITVILCLVALSVVIVSGVGIAHWLALPILELSQASEALAQGEWHRPVQVRGSRESSILARSFNWMAQELKQLIEQLAAEKQNLEQRVEQRTTELQASEEKFARAFQSSPMPIEITTLTEGRFLEVNDRFCSLLGYAQTEVLGHTSEELHLWDNLDDRDRITTLLQTQGAVHNEVVELRTKAGQVRLAEISAELIKIQGEQCILWIGQDITERKLAEDALRQEQVRSEELLLNILPKPIADRLKQDQSAIAEHFESVTILFADIVNFTSLSANISAKDLVDLLNQIFSSFDQLAESLELEKIKTIGDAYMVAAGLPMPRADHAAAIADMALAMQIAIQHIETDYPTPLQIRIGINTGVVVAGVIGIKKFIYDLWGDAVNVASRMESSGKPGQIQVTETTYEYLQENYILEERGLIKVKGKGEMKTYWLKGRKVGS